MTTTRAGVDGRRLRGDRTRTAILDHAVALATTAGLEGLTLSRLAGRLDVGKSAVLAHFPSKEALQLAAIEHARHQVVREVVRPALAAPRGVRRLWALHLSRLAFYERAALPGGCFIATAEFEMLGRPGAARDRVAEVVTEWTGLLRGLTEQAVALGELAADTDPGLLAFEVDAAGLACVARPRLTGDHGPYVHARRSVRDRLVGLGADPALLTDPAPAPAREPS